MLCIIACSSCAFVVSTSRQRRRAWFTTSFGPLCGLLCRLNHRLALLSTLHVSARIRKDLTYAQGLSCSARLRPCPYTCADANTLLRFLRGRDYDISKATALFVTHLKWRKDNNVDTILEDFDFKERDQYLSVYPQGYYNTDKHGRPMTIQHLGQVKPKRINEITTEERMVKYHIQEYERFLKKMAPVCSELAGRHIDQSFAVLDVKGTHHLTCCRVCVLW
jgi:hypothetical protein